MTPADLRSARRALGLTQAQLGEAVGVEGRQVRSWEAGRWPVPLAVELLIRIWTNPKCPAWAMPPSDIRSPLPSPARRGSAGRHGKPA